MGGVIGWKGYTAVRVTFWVSPTSWHWGLKQAYLVLIDPPDDKPIDLLQIVETMIRIHLIRSISAYEVQHRQFPSGMFIGPSS
jgi:hypothetical protein